MSTDQSIALSFFELDTQDFNFTLYRRPYGEGEKSEDNPGLSKHELPTECTTVHQDADYESYWVSLDPRDDLVPFVCRPDDNPYVTCKYLYKLLKDKCISAVVESVYEIPTEDEFSRRTIEFVIDSFEEGDQIVWLQPYFLKSKQCFGFLAEFRFRAKWQFRQSTNARKLSLSLDSHGRRNRNFYSDRYDAIERFVSHQSANLFRLGRGISISSQMTLLEYRRLDTKRFVFANSGVSTSQFRGIKQHGPLQTVENGSKAYFVFREDDRPYSHDLFRALRGDTFPKNFPGMESVFGFRFDGTNVGGTGIAFFDTGNIEAALDRILEDAGDRRAVPVFLSPFNKFSNSENDREIYAKVKHTCLSIGIPSQFVSIPLMRSKNQFKWAISSIALQLFSKMGGVPWTVEQSTDNSLIVGISQALDRQGDEIRRYFAYSIFTDSTGRFRELKTLSEATGIDEHISNIKSNLRQAILTYSQDFDSIVVHTTFAIKRKELDAITDVIQSIDSESNEDKKFVVMKFNDSNKFFGYATDNNSMIPYESSFVPLSYREYLVWYEGLEHPSSRIPARIERPIHVKFIYPRIGFESVDTRAHLQDALNISGANWRGFNAKSLPVSIFYAKLVAQQYRQFKRFGLNDIDFELLNPWFL